MGIKLKNIWKKVLPIIKGIAPLAAGALGGSYGLVAATAIRAALGTSTDEEAVSILLAQNPEELVKLKLAEKEIEFRREELGISREEMYLADVQSARERHMQVRDQEPARLTYLAIVLTVAVVAVIVIWSSSFDDFSKSILSLVVGNLLARTETGYNFFLGTSMGSKVKGAQLEEAMKRLGDLNG